MNDRAKATFEHVTVVRNERLSEGVGLIVFEAPRCARLVRPGHFVHLRIDRDASELLRRPFSIHLAQGNTVEILYQVLGAGTRRLAEKKPGDTSMDIVGPLGTGWSMSDATVHALLVSGGLGAAPLGMLAVDLARRGVAVVCAMGAPTVDRLVARDLFEKHARRVECATDDGSSGHHGFVTDISERLLDETAFDVVYTCGPEAMQRIVAEQARARAVACQVSLERLMACGVGACLSCVVTTRSGRKRACVDGPVFDAEEVVWDGSETPPRH